jgi:hypothetical protein
MFVATNFRGFICTFSGGLGFEVFIISKQSITFHFPNTCSRPKYSQIILLGNGVRWESILR